MNGTNGVSVSKVAQIMDLYNFLPDMDLKKHRIKRTCKKSRLGRTAQRIIPSAS